MQKVTVKTNSGSVTEFRPTKESFSAPVILKEYMEDGTRMYSCVGDRTFLADVYDKSFVVKKGKVMPRRYTGVNPDRKRGTLV
jgi:hypothetical protein